MAENDLQIIVLTKRNRTYVISNKL